MDQQVCIGLVSRQEVCLFIDFYREIQLTADAELREPKTGITIEMRA